VGAQRGLALAEQGGDGLGQLMRDARGHLTHAVDARGMGQLCFIGQQLGAPLVAPGLLAALPDQLNRTDQRGADQGADQHHAQLTRLRGG
jgi:hypothetical protein